LEGRRDSRRRPADGGRRSFGDTVKIHGASR
jgi:hypothetical protein